MKKLLIIIFLNISFCINAKSQDITESIFYKSFYKNFKVPVEIDSKSGKNYLFSLKLILNKEGIIIDYKLNKTVDLLLKQRIEEAFTKIDKDGLKQFDFKNKTIILPVFILYTTDIKRTILNKYDGVWSYEDSFCNNLLPPIVIFYSHGRGVIN
ncbi:MAG: hypothetical protein WBP45_13940 [Daejeonella sp.]